MADDWLGLAGTHDSWGPQIKGLTGTDRPNGDETMAVDREPGEGHNEVGGIEVCAFDNRGMGRSSVPTKKSDYTSVFLFLLTFSVLTLKIPPLLFFR